MYQDFLKRTALLKGLSERQLDQLSVKLFRHQYKKGEVVFREGQKAEHLFFVYQGRVKLYKSSKKGKSQTLQLFSSPSVFAEVPALEGGVFPAHCEAIENTTLLLLKRSVLLALIQEDSELALNMIAILASRLRAFSNTIADLTLKETDVRLANYLLQLSHVQGNEALIRLDLSKPVLANFLGTSRENLYRVIDKLQHQAVIDMNGRYIKIIDYSGLKKLAEENDL
ncbi:MAG: Crp/Fnr family transcriptional regulator [Pseudomonadota bacterium]